MCRFYSWQPITVKQLNTKEFNDYHSAIDIISGREMLIEMTISDYPNLKQNTRSTIFNNTKKRALIEDVKEVSVDELAKFLGKGINGR